MSYEEPFDTQSRNEVHKAVQKMRDDELVQFIRDTVVRLGVLADRLDSVADTKEGDGAGKHTRQGD